MVPEIVRVIDHRRIARNGISVSVKLRSRVLHARAFCPGNFETQRMPGQTFEDIKRINVEK